MHIGRVTDGLPDLALPELLRTAPVLRGVARVRI
jgi:hypothetical protein